MKSTNEKVSLRQQLSKYNRLALCILFASILFYIALLLYTAHQYGNAFYQYRYVSEFYESMDNANESMKEYLYGNAEESLKRYQKEIETAQMHIEELKQQNMQEGWRVVLLSNMLESYKQQVDLTTHVFEDNQIQYEQEYNQMLKSYELIKQTSNIYYDLLTDEMEIQNQNLDRMKLYLVLFSVLFAMMVVIWLVYYTRSTTQSITEPLVSILKNINLIKQGTYDLTKISNTNLEMHALCDAMEDMADAVQKELTITKEKAELEKRLLETENENLKKDELLAQSELKMLQNQINPHFLFNTLNMTYKLALSEHAYKCSEMIAQTSALLRYGLDKQNKMSDLQSEIKAVEHYIAIQEQRLGDRVRFEILLDHNLPNITIPGMIFQPIIENSLKHGLKDCEEHGEIILSIRYVEDQVWIQISDNGEGIEEERCEQMMLTGFHEERGDHLGLYNIVKRLEMFYQDHVDISIESALGCGFSFHIKIKVV